MLAILNTNLFILWDVILYVGNATLYFSGFHNRDANRLRLPKANDFMHNKSLATADFIL